MVLTPLHGLGGGANLPISATSAIIGGSAALVVSFAVLLLAWREPRFDRAQKPRPVPVGLARLIDSTAWAALLRLAGLAFCGFLVWPLAAGPDTVLNPVFGVLYVWVWVGLVPASLLFGRFIRAVSPVRTLHLVFSKAMRRSPSEAWLKYPERLGSWPAALGLLAFAWLELVEPESTTLGPVRIWLAGYLVITLVGALVFGDRWLERADPFEYYSTLVAHLSPWGRDAEGALVWVSPLRHLAQLKTEAGTVAAVAVLLGSTAFDSWQGTGTWIRFVQASSWNPTVLGTAMLTFSVLSVGVIFVLAAMATPGTGPAKRLLPRQLVHSLVPIVIGYMIAHYLSFLFETGQQTLRQLSDPMDDGSNLFGTAGLDVNYWFTYHPGALATIKVLAIVLGHVLGVVAAHDRSLQVLPRKAQVLGQLPLLIAMVGYTYLGLYLLFGA